MRLEHERDELPGTGRDPAEAALRQPPRVERPGVHEIRFAALDAGKLLRRRRSHPDQDRVEERPRVPVAVVGAQHDASIVNAVDAKCAGADHRAVRRAHGDGVTPARELPRQIHRRAIDDDDVAVGIDGPGRIRGPQRRGCLPCLQHRAVVQRHAATDAKTPASADRLPRGREPRLQPQIAVDGRQRFEHERQDVIPRRGLRRVRWRRGRIDAADHARGFEAQCAAVMRPRRRRDGNNRRRVSERKKR